ncbi:MAG: hypothetical protein D6776_12285 [Planctomycetota bacterium]|nr:MAG: hypothetical protein D6776_12285 [Planctomycetota bacterium]
MARTQPPPAWVGVAAAILAIVALGSGTWLLRSLEFLPGPRWIEPWRPAPPTATAVPRTIARGTPRTEAVTLFVADGMRRDVSLELPAWQALRAQGVDVRCRVLGPSFTRVGFANLLTGVGPRRHGFLSNYNRRPSPVPSVFDLARRAGIPTCLLSPVPTALPQQFPEAFEQRGPFEAAKLAGGATPRLTLVYSPEPDRSWHRAGVWSEAGRRAAREADAALAAVLAASDLSRETVIAVSDHGHLDRGGHGGREAVVCEVPLVLAGAGIRPAAGTLAVGADQRDVAATIALLLGLPVRPGMTGRPLYEALADPPPRERWLEREREAPFEPRLAPISRAVSTALALALFPWLVLRPRGLRPLLATLVCLGVFAALYAAWGRPWSFSLVNAESEVPATMATITLFAAVAAGFGLALSRDAVRFGAWALCLEALVAGALWGTAGIGAPLAIDHLTAAFFAYLGFTLLFGTAVVVAAAIAVGAGCGGGWSTEESKT